MATAPKHDSLGRPQSLVRPTEHLSGPLTLAIGLTEARRGLFRRPYDYPKTFAL